MSKKHLGSRLDDFLEEEGMLEDVTAVALKRVIAWQISEEMKAQNLTKTALAKRMHTSRAALNRLLDDEDASLTLTTLASAASALGKTVSLHLAPADGAKLPASRTRAAAKAGVNPSARASTSPAGKKTVTSRRSA